MHHIYLFVFKMLTTMYSKQAILCPLFSLCKITIVPIFEGYKAIVANRILPKQLGFNE